MFEVVAEAAEVASQPPLDWTAIIVQSLITFGVIAGAFLPAYLGLRAKIARTEENSVVIRDETRNAHNPDQPLRHDIDILLERTKAIPLIQKDIGGIKADIRQLYHNDHDLWDTVASKRRPQQGENS